MEKKCLVWGLTMDSEASLDGFAHLRFPSPREYVGVSDCLSYVFISIFGKAEVNVYKFCVI